MSRISFHPFAPDIHLTRRFGEQDEQMLRKPADTDLITADITLVSCLYLTCSQIPVCHLCEGKEYGVTLSA